MLYIHDDIYKYLIIWLRMFLFFFNLHICNKHPKCFNASILHDSTYSVSIKRKTLSENLSYFKIDDLRTRVKSSNFRHQVNSQTPLQTVEIQISWLLMIRLIRIFTVCLVLYTFLFQ